MERNVRSEIKRKQLDKRQQFSRARKLAWQFTTFSKSILIRTLFEMQSSSQNLSDSEMIYPSLSMTSSVSTAISRLSHLKNVRILFCFLFAFIRRFDWILLLISDSAWVDIFIFHGLLFYTHCEQLDSLHKRTIQWSTVLLEKLTGSQLVRKFPAFYGTRRFITAFITARHLCPFWAR